MEIDDMLNARNAAAADAQLRQQQMNSVANMDNNAAYAMNSQTGSGMHQQQSLPQNQSMMSYPTLTQAPTSQLIQNDLMDNSSHDDQPQQQDTNGSRPQSEAPKAFSCSTCAKGFARRSDLARHGQFRRIAGFFTLTNFEDRANTQRGPTTSV